MNYALGYSLDVGNLFMNYDLSKLDLTAKQCEKIIHNRHKEVIAEKVFREAVQLVVDDIIENNNSFSLPTGSRTSIIHMQKFSFDDFKKRRKLGKWKKVDYFTSIYTGYQMCLDYKRGEVDVTKPIYLDPARRDRIDEQTNNLVPYF